jgi:uncharacterized protein (TIGR02231 family)
MLPLDAPISVVTVYTDRARITRSGNVTVVGGEQTLLLPNLPMSLEEESVRVSGRGAGIRILGVEVKTAFLTTTPEANIAAIEREIEALRAQDGALEDEDLTIAARLQMLSSTREKAGENFGRLIAHKRATTNEYVEFSRFASEEQEGLQSTRRDIVKAQRELRRQIVALEQLLNRFRHSINSESRREIHVMINAAEATVFEVEANYTVYGANWHPLYDVRLTDSDVQLTYLANISQHSGEDWNNIALSLSTARPAMSAVLPELHPQYVNQYTPPPPPRMPMPAAQQMRAARKMFDAVPQSSSVEDEPAPMAEVQQTTVQASEGGVALTYRVGTPVTVPSDGSTQKTTVTIERLRAALDHLTVPKIAPEAYLRAKITNTSEYTLLPGQVSIYHGDEFVGKTFIKTIAPNEQFEAQLGVDDRVRVKRELIQREVNKRFIGGNRQTQYRYKITLTNLLPREAKITLSDQLPVSSNEQIKVRLTDAAPQPQEQTQMNILRWELTLKPSEKREITFGFVVEHPTEMRVVGLE